MYFTYVNYSYMARRRYWDGKQWKEKPGHAISKNQNYFWKKDVRG